jgi:hypothetical protein
VSIMKKEGTGIAIPFFITAEKEYVNMNVDSMQTSEKLKLGAGIRSGPKPILNTSGLTGVFDKVLQQADSTRYKFETGILVAVNPDLRNTRETLNTVCPRPVGIVVN